MSFALMSIKETFSNLLAIYTGPSFNNRGADMILSPDNLFPQAWGSRFILSLIAHWTVLRVFGRRLS